jgi:large subunit ribosomal protein L34e
MPRGMYKSRTLRRIAVKVPGGAVKRHYRQRKPGKAVCSTCQKPLAGVPRELPRQLTKLPKTAKRPQRPYGGVLCSACLRRMLLTKAREER